MVIHRTRAVFRLCKETLIIIKPGELRVDLFKELQDCIPIRAEHCFLIVTQIVYAASDVTKLDAAIDTIS
ncbi:MAG: hypothetical protein SWO11_18930 [Thermodesulfobacteriota bacterium]|nr:hypothetical protein [Thermodesulfobacteriota bacterium]